MASIIYYLGLLFFMTGTFMLAFVAAMILISCAILALEYIEEILRSIFR